MPTYHIQHELIPTTATHAGEITQGEQQKMLECSTMHYLTFLQTTPTKIKATHTCDGDVSFSFVVVPVLLISTFFRTVRRVESATQKKNAQGNVLSPHRTQNEPTHSQTDGHLNNNTTLTHAAWP